MIENLILFLFVCLVGLFGGVATWWIESLIGDPYKEEGVNTRAILSVYGTWVRQKYDQYEKRLEDRLTRMSLNIEQEERYEARQLNHFKALGACPLCFGVYVTAACSLVIFWFTGVSLWWTFATLPMFHFSISWLMDRY